MANDIKVLTFITNEMLRQTKNNLQFINNISGEDMVGRFTDAPKKGETIKIRKPTRYVGRDGEVFAAEDYIERTVDMVVQPTAGVDLQFTNRELMFNVDQIAERVVKPAALTLANKIDRAAMSLAYSYIANTVGVPGTVPTALKTYNQARAKMSWESAPQDEHTVLITPDMTVEAVDAGKTFFNAAGEISSQYKTGLLGTNSGGKVYECQNLITHVVGPLGGVPLINGANQTGSMLLLKGFTAAAALRLKRGDTFTVPGMYAVNPWTRQSIGALRQISVTADVSSAADGTASVPIYPAIVLSGPFQNVTATGADSAAITIWAAANTVTPQGLRFHKEAFLFGSFDQPNPGGAVDFCKQVSDSQTGLKIRYIRDWDTKNNVQISRMDVVYAFGASYPEFACRIAS